MDRTTRSSTRRRILVFGSACGAAVLAGCGDDGPGEQEPVDDETPGDSPADDDAPDEPNATPDPDDEPGASLQ
ncbi:hypothetical protein D8Y22_17245 [Salinadaptatus halalkaliphilus]|uniref:Uncharacterized protein n=1 Tax=Salinadaptatus halalkaliphilus TaxID=2419781 RepID=A0A4S3THU4_9EURY|nr:hypothetical protein D8Y22_17245 [Salinadaptatus halalkaliphilus]